MVVPLVGSGIIIGGGLMLRLRLWVVLALLVLFLVIYYKSK